MNPDDQAFAVIKIIANQWYWKIDITATISRALYQVLKGNSFHDESFDELSKILRSSTSTYQDYFAFYQKIQWVTMERSFIVLGSEISALDALDDKTFCSRLLMIDESIKLPVNQPLKFIISSNDVLHSFNIPALGIKIDAVPGRLSEITTVIERPGYFIGQCAELCGENHGFMPIIIEAVTMEEFINFFDE